MLINRIICNIGILFGILILLLFKLLE